MLPHKEILGMVLFFIFSSLPSSHFPLPIFLFCFFLLYIFKSTYFMAIIIIRSSFKCTRKDGKTFLEIQSAIAFLSYILSFC